jgi:hypothetical protein
MRLWQRSAYDLDLKRATEGLHSTGSELERKYRVALVLYGFLAVLVWFTMGEGKVLVHGRPVELRLVPLIVIGGLALRTVLARHAERIRRQGRAEGGEAESGSSAPVS